MARSHLDRFVDRYQRWERPNEYRWVGDIERRPERPAQDDPEYQRFLKAMGRQEED